MSQQSTLVSAGALCTELTGKSHFDAVIRNTGSPQGSGLHLITPYITGFRLNSGSCCPLKFCGKSIFGCINIRLIESFITPRKKVVLRQEQEAACPRKGRRECGLMQINEGLARTHSTDFHFKAETPSVRPFTSLKPVDSLDLEAERRMKDKIKTIPDDPSAPLHGKPWQIASSLSQWTIAPSCKIHFRCLFVHTPTRLQQ